LFRRMIEDRGAILRADIVALAIDRGRIVQDEEDLQDLAVADDFRIERDLNDFGMPRVAVADLPISRVLHRSAGVARFDAFDALDLLEGGLDAPETAATQRGEFAVG